MKKDTKKIESASLSPYKVGSIYLVKYRSFGQDPTPLILVLYAGKYADFHSAKTKDLLHAINLNYLKADMIDDVYNMVAMIANKQMSGSNTYNLYHDYMKTNLNPILRKAYRTYDLSKMSNAKLVSKGFKESLGFLNNPKYILDKEQKQNRMKALIKAKVNAAKVIESESTKLITKNINVSLSLEEAERRARIYMDAIQKAKKPEELDLKKFTGLFGQRYKT